jgi:hypothetical protein
VIFGTDLTLGWNAFEPRDQENLAELKRFYDDHWRFFESKEEQIEYPGFPVQGNWKVDGLGLPDDVLDKLYFRNALRLIPRLQA